MFPSKILFSLEAPPSLCPAVQEVLLWLFPIEVGHFPAELGDVPLPFAGWGWTSVGAGGSVCFAVYVQPEPASTTSTILFEVEADFAVVASLERAGFEERSIEDLEMLAGDPTAVVVGLVKELAVLAVLVPIAVVAVDPGPEACSVSAVGLAVPAVAFVDEAVVAGFCDCTYCVQ